MKEAFNLTCLGLFPLGKSPSGKGMGINMDERTIIIEQERLAKEKKRQKNRKKKRIAGAAGAVLAAGIVWYAGWGRNLQPEVKQTAVEVTAASGQEIVYAGLKSIKGNEITYIPTDGAAEAAPSEAKEQTEAARQEAAAEQTAYIPVGTEVITRLGTSTTFSRLAAGDNVALITEKSGGESVIVKVYIVD